jgi:single-stranded-DNA-specific exonuclease
LAEPLNKFIWRENRSINANDVSNLAETFDIPTAGARFLVSRDMNTPEAVRDYLFAEDLRPHDPYAFNEMESAVRSVKEAIAEKKRILIHGDYDVDGICGTAVLHHFLKGLIPHVFRFLPDRRKDGYGVAARAVDWAIENRIGLVIAVDCGTSDGELINRLLSAGIEVVICDHHEFPVDGGAKGIILNPVREGEDYPFKGLCGTGVAIKLIEALEAAQLAGAVRSRTLLDLVALATVGDMAPLTGENRFYVRRGIKQINEELRTGLFALVMSAAGKVPEISTYHLGYVLGPRLNAPGRISNPKPALELLCTEEVQEARELASMLEMLNERRQNLTEKVKQAALDAIDTMPNREQEGGFILASAGWDEGVLGIAASRVTEEFGRPAILISVREGLGKGSGRSVEGVNLKAQLDRCKHHLVRYGGHTQAVGLTIEAAKIEAFISDISKELKSSAGALPERPQLRIDAALDEDECSMELLDFLSVCEPFGFGNRAPIWKMTEVQVLPQTRFVGRGHLKLHLRDKKDRTFEGISFNWERRAVPPERLHDRWIDLAFRLKKGYYLERHYPEFNVLDIRQNQG